MLLKPKSLKGYKKPLSNDRRGGSVEMGAITPEEYKIITSEDYVA